MASSFFVALTRAWNGHKEREHAFLGNSFTSGGASEKDQP